MRLRIILSFGCSRGLMINARLNIGDNNHCLKVLGLLALKMVW
jgi:hypothetical protein